MELAVFKPNNHSRWRVAWRSVDGAVRGACAALLKNYGGDTLLEAHQVDEWERRSHNYRLRVASGGGTRLLLLREHIQWNDERDIRAADRIVTYLDSCGFPVPKIVTKKNGDTLVRHNGNFWQLYEFVDGNHYRGTRRELESIARTVGELHVLLERHPSVEDIKGKSVKRPPWTQDRWTQILDLARRRETEVDVLLDGNRGVIIEAMRHVEDRRNVMERSPRQLIHRDLHPWNTLYAGDGEIKALLDFSDACFGELFRDVGFALHRFVRQFMVCGTRRDPPYLREGIRTFVSAYQRANPILAGAGALAAIGVFISDELLTKTLSNAEDYYVKGTDETTSNGELMKKLVLLKEAAAISALLGEL